jgi:hypothetical protein
MEARLKLDSLIASTEAPNITVKTELTSADFVVAIVSESDLENIPAILSVLKENSELAEELKKTKNLLLHGRKSEGFKQIHISMVSWGDNK